MISIDQWVHSVTGGIHVLFSCLGLLTGTFVLFSRKGGKIHKIIGYVFTVSLVIVNISALGIYDFNQGMPSVFHYLIPISLFFLGYGLYPMIRRKKPLQLNRHIIGMNAAALGLWAAAATEYFVRELSSGLQKNELILYSFLISVPFGIAITWSITYHIKRLSKP